MGGRGGASGLTSARESPDRGVSSTDGRMKTAIVYHGTYASFDKFDASKIPKGKNQVNQYGEGFYFADTPERAHLYGDNVYEVVIKYSTDRRTAKKTGRQQDFQYSKDRGIWVIPYSKAGNLRIRKKRRME